MKKTLSLILAVIMLVSVFGTAVSAADADVTKVVVSSVKVSNDGLLVKWSPIANATSYIIYRYDSLNSEPVAIDTTTANQYLDKNNLVFNGEEINDKEAVTYYYAIAATMKDGSFVDYVFADENNSCELVCPHSKMQTVTIPASVYAPGKTYKVCSVCGYQTKAKVLNQLAPATPKISDLKNTNKGVSFKWSLVDGAQEYFIYRKTNGGSWKVIDTVDGSVNKYLDSSAKSGTKYQYTVRACGGEANAANIIATKTTTKSLEWKVDNAYNLYYIERVCFDDGSFEFVAQLPTSSATLSDDLGVKTLKYTDKGLDSKKSYQYFIRAALFSGFKASAEIEFLATIKDLKVSNMDSGITFTCESVKGAKTYKVYRKVKGEDSYTYIGAGKAYKTTDATGKEVTRYKFTDTNAEPGVDYIYTAKAVDGKNAGGYVKEGVSIRRLETPKLVKIANSKQGITVTWSKVTGAAGYKVYRKTADGWKHIGTVKNVKSNAYLVKDDQAGGLTNAKVNTYTVKAYYGDSNSAYVKDGIKILRIQEPKLEGVKSTRSGVYVSWDSVAGAKGYYVYSKTSGGSWKRVGTVEGQSKESFVDKSAKKGTTYTYTVKAYNGNYVSSYDKTGLKVKDIY